MNSMPQDAPKQHFDPDLFNNIGVNSCGYPSLVNTLLATGVEIKAHELLPRSGHVLGISQRLLTLQFEHDLPGFHDRRDVLTEDGTRRNSVLR